MKTFESKELFVKWWKDCIKFIKNESCGMTGKVKVYKKIWSRMLAYLSLTNPNKLTHPFDEPH